MKITEIKTRVLRKMLRATERATEPDYKVVEILRRELARRKGATHEER